MNDSTPPPAPAAQQASKEGKLTGSKPPPRGPATSAPATWRCSNLAIDSKLRGCDLVALRVDDVAPNGYAVDRAIIRQSKTGRPVRFELTVNRAGFLGDCLVPPRDLQ